MKKTVMFDLNNLAIRRFFISDVSGDKNNPDYESWKYFIFEIIYNSITKFKDATEIILAVDSKPSWRLASFPRYKESRKLKRDKDEVDWNTFYKEYDSLCEMIKESIPFKVIKYNRSEADDVIGILARYIQNEVIVVSNDSDYLQLCDTKKIKVWNPTDKEFSKLSMTREDFLISLILKGQKKDDILNCITPSDYPIELRKPPFGDVKVQKILKEGLDKFLNTEIEIKKELEGLDEEGNKKKYEVKFKPINNYRRNEILIDFNKIPDIISSGIKNTYDEYQLPNPEGIYNFFKKNEWNGFLDNYNVVEQRLLNLYGEN